MKARLLFPFGARLVLGATLLWAGAVKLPELDRFAVAVEEYDILPQVLVAPFSAVIPWLEVSVGCGLVLGVWTRSNALLAALTLLSFAFALGINIYRGSDVSCGCFSTSLTGGTLEGALARDLVLLALAGVVALAPRTPLSLDGRL